MNKKYLASVLSAALLCSAAFAPDVYAEPSRTVLAGNTDTSTAMESGLLSVIVNQMGSDTNVLDDRYSGYFLEGTATDGVKALVAAGACSINGFVIPATAEELASNYPDGYMVNEAVWLAQTDGGYVVDRTTYLSYDEAVTALFRRVPAGVETKLYDEDGDGCADRLNIEYVEAVIVDQIAEQEDGTLCVTRAKLPDAIVWSENDGTVYDGTHFTPESGERIPSENFDSSIQEGDLALFALTTNGWSMKRATQVNGILVAGADHEYYQMDTVQYEDAMRFSRDNLMISNRCGEYLNAHEYFGFLANAGGLKVNLWLVPATDQNRQAAPAGFTSGENAAAFLALAVEMAKEKLNAV
ncbi:MAG: hypothetical protein LUC94_00420 [Clostridiales bacterium]|nr:hypothetical protein [Clostridiales bacterium]